MSKINLYASIMPYDFNLALSFHKSNTVGDIHYFLEETFKKLRIKYKVGRIEIKNNKAWLLPQYIIGEFLSQKEEIVVYSIEYGIRQREISDIELDDIDELFIGKKLKRKREDEDEEGKKSFNRSKILSVNANKVKNNLQLKSEKSNREESVYSDNNEEKEREDEQSEENENKEKKKSSENDDNDQSNDEEENDESGSDKDEDIQIASSKKK